MDKEREYRFLLPTFFFIISFLCIIGIQPTVSYPTDINFFDGLKEHLINKIILNSSEEAKIKIIEIIILFIFGSAFLLLIGFIFSAITIIMLRLFFLVARVLDSKKLWHSELCLKEDTYNFVENNIFKTNYSAKENTKLEKTKYRYTSILAFVNIKFPVELQKWASRKWSIFLISCNSIVALFSSLILSKYIASIFFDFNYLDFNYKIFWQKSIYFIIGILSINAILIYRDLIKIFDFLATCKDKNFLSKDLKLLKTASKIKK